MKPNMRRPSGILESCASDMAASVQPAEHGGERDDKNLVAERIGDAQLPAAPVLAVRPRHQRSPQTVGVRAELGKIIQGGAAMVDQEMVGIGAVEIDFGHVA